MLDPRSLVSELYRRDPLLALTGGLQIVVLAVVMLVAPFDSRTVLGVDPWLKPGKFLASIAIYVWTIAWFLPYVRVPRWAPRVISVGVSSVMLLEIGCILLQSARGVRSHFNDGTGFDQLVFGLMGLGIAVNTILVGLLGLLLFTNPDRSLPRPYLWAVRLGVVVILAGSVEGGVMIARGAHAVGVADGGAGLPIVNWSVRGGDLRAAHAVGLHGLQVIPFWAFLIGRRRPRLSERTQIWLVVGFAGLYVGLGWLLFAQAMAGRPLLA